MIYQYEAGILEYIHGIIPEIEEATYSTDEDLLNSLDKIKKFPSFFYYRKETPYEDNRIFQIQNTDGKTTKFSVFLQEYEGTILVEHQLAAFRIASDLRFKINHSPFITVRWPDPTSTLNVQIALSYIKITEERQPDDKKGTSRLVKFGWSSQLFFDTKPEQIYGLVEKVKIYLDAEGRGVVIGKDQQGRDVILNSLIKQL